jgi:hypothetical protein
MVHHLVKTEGYKVCWKTPTGGGVDRINYCNGVAFFFSLLTRLYNIVLKIGYNNELNQKVLERTRRLLRYETDNKENDASNNYSLLLERLYRIVT